MALKLTEGVTVRLADREAVAADAKSQLFYPHYSGLIGTVTKLYPDDTANVMVDLDTLPKEIRARHQTGTDAMRQKWLDGLSDEARNRLSAAEKKFALRYSLLAAVTDLTPIPTPLPAEPSRKSLTDIEAAETQHLDEIVQKKKP